jgi:DNA-binding PadR family transcriptional regulator
LDDLEGNGMIEGREGTIGRRTVAFYRPTQKGIPFLQLFLFFFKNKTHIFFSLNDAWLEISLLA